MNPIKAESPAAVSPEEVQRGIAEYRRLGFAHRAPAHVVYHGPHQVCPWAGCGYRIAAIGFQLEQMGDPGQVEQWLEAWWQGPGLVGPCPGCGHLVLFGMSDKRAVANAADLKPPLLPRDWYHRAYLVPAGETGAVTDNGR